MLSRTIVYTELSSLILFTVCSNANIMVWPSYYYVNSNHGYDISASSQLNRSETISEWFVVSWTDHFARRPFRRRVARVESDREFHSGHLWRHLACHYDWKTWYPTVRSYFHYGEKTRRPFRRSFSLYLFGLRRIPSRNFYSPMLENKVCCM